MTSTDSHAIVTKAGLVAYVRTISIIAHLVLLHLVPAITLVVVPVSMEMLHFLALV